jgi:hypothetical protein
VNRRLLFISACVVLSVIICLSVVLLSAGSGDTPLAPTATAQSFDRSANKLCTPLSNLVNDRHFDAAQLLVARSQVEELSQVPVPLDWRASFNVLLGVLTSYANTYAQALSAKTGPTDVVYGYRTRALSLMKPLGLTKCRL